MVSILFGPESPGKLIQFQNTLGNLKTAGNSILAGGKELAFCPPGQKSPELFSIGEQLFQMLQTLPGTGGLDHKTMVVPENVFVERSKDGYSPTDLHLHTKIVSDSDNPTTYVELATTFENGQPTIRLTRSAGTHKISLYMDLNENGEFLGGGIVENNRKEEYRDGEPRSRWIELDNEGKVSRCLIQVPRDAESDDLFETRGQKIDMSRMISELITPNFPEVGNDDGISNILISQGIELGSPYFPRVQAPTNPPITDVLQKKTVVAENTRLPHDFFSEVYFRADSGYMPLKPFIQPLVNLQQEFGQSGYSLNIAQKYKAEHEIGRILSDFGKLRGKVPVRVNGKDTTIGYGEFLYDHHYVRYAIYKPDPDSALVFGVVEEVKERKSEPIHDAKELCSKIGIPRVVLELVREGD